MSSYSLLLYFSPVAWRGLCGLQQRRCKSSPIGHGHGHGLRIRRSRVSAPRMKMHTPLPNVFLVSRSWRWHRERCRYQTHSKSKHENTPSTCCPGDLMISFYVFFVVVVLTPLHQIAAMAQATSQRWVVYMCPWGPCHLLPVAFIFHPHYVTRATCAMYRPSRL